MYLIYFFQTNADTVSKKSSDSSNDVEDLKQQLANERKQKAEMQKELDLQVIKLMLFSGSPFLKSNFHELGF